MCLLDAALQRNNHSTVQNKLKFRLHSMYEEQNDRGFRINRMRGVEKQRVERRIIFGLVHKNSSLFMEPKYTAKCGSHT